jgi:hypothetical protein
LAALKKLRRTVIDQNWDPDRVRGLFRDRFDKGYRGDGRARLG